MIMKKQKLAFIAMLLMVVFSFSGLLVLLGDINVSLTSITLLVGIVFYFITREPEEKEAFSFKAVPQLLKDWKLDLLILVPLFMDVLCYGLAKVLIPEFLAHLSGRIDFLSFRAVILLLAELIIAALGEEIAWRGFFLNRLSKRLPLLPSLLISAILFSICHFAVGSPAVVMYDLLFIAINAIFYGLIFHKTNSLIVSTLSHFLANLFGVIALSLIL